MKPVVGQYFITRLRGRAAIYRYDSVSENGSSASHIETCYNFEEAVRRMYALNGWNEPKDGFKFNN